MNPGEYKNNANRVRDDFLQSGALLHKDADGNILPADQQRKITYDPMFLVDRRDDPALALPAPVLAAPALPAPVPPPAGVGVGDQFEEFQVNVLAAGA